MKTPYWMGIITLLIFGVGGVLLIEFGQDTSIFQVFSEGKALSIQLLTGLITGLIGSGLAIWIISRKFFRKEKHFYHNLISGWKLDYNGMIFLSFCAGIGEELFFRGGIQPFIGIWWTSVLFVALHGYLNPSNWRISIYGLTMVGIIAGFGYLYNHIGIISAMVAHTVLDMILFLYINQIRSL